MRMARRRKRDRGTHERNEAFVSFLKRDNVRGVLGIFCLAVAVFLTLAATGLGGMVGTLLYERLFMLVGVGYFLLPLSCVIGMVMCMRTLGEGSINTWSIVSMAVFLFSSLGIVNIVLPGRGGIEGKTVFAFLSSSIFPTILIFVSNPLSLTSFCDCATVSFAVNQSVTSF